MAVIQSTDLDFDTIKANLKTYLQNQPEFADYNFEGAGLSNILDVLAYNTHINGLVANMGINESFLSSAQLRASVVGHAEVLGYNVRSRTAAMASVRLSIATTDSVTPTVSIPKGTLFTASIDDVSYTFRTLEAYTANNDGTGNFVFQTSDGLTSIPIYEGTEKTKTFIVGDTNDSQVYVIPDTTIDTSTLVVNVFDTTSSSSFTPYSNVNNVVRINSDSTIYIIKEVPNGYYELTFSDGNILGKAPSAGNKIEATYLSSKGAAANNGSVFVADEQVEVNTVPYTLNVTTVSNSAGGDEKESVSSIKLNAPRAFSTQQRLVTADDYKAIILQRYSSVLDDVTAWGGNDNVPPIYGRTYVALKFKTGISADVKQTTKNSIVSALSNNLAIMSIDTVFSDPTETFLEFTTTFNFDPDQTGTTLQTTEGLVNSTISNFVSTNLNSFGKIFRRSNLLAQIDDLSPAILNSRMDVKVQQRLVIAADELGTLIDKTVNFPVAIAAADDVNFRITSSKFIFNGVKSSIRNQLESTKLQVVAASDGSLQADNIGEYEPENGKVVLRGLNISSFEGSAIKISVVPANQSTIKPLRNYILNIDASLSTARGVVDYQTTRVTL